MPAWSTSHSSGSMNPASCIQWAYSCRLYEPPSPVHQHVQSEQSPERGLSFVVIHDAISVALESVPQSAATVSARPALPTLVDT